MSIYLPFWSDPLCLSFTELTNSSASPEFNTNPVWIDIFERIQLSSFKVELKFWWMLPTVSASSPFWQIWQTRCINFCSQAPLPAFFFFLKKNNNLHFFLLQTFSTNCVYPCLTHTQKKIPTILSQSSFISVLIFNCPGSNLRLSRHLMRVMRTQVPELGRRDWSLVWCLRCSVYLIQDFLHKILSSETRGWFKQLKKLARAEF